MGRKTVLLDDLDGTELPDDTQPIRLAIGRSDYRVYLTEANHEKLLNALQPFIENAEKVGTPVADRVRSSSPSNADKEKLKAVREWAIATNFKYKNAAGEEKTLGDRGRIPQDVIDAYEKANA